MVAWSCARAALNACTRGRQNEDGSAACRDAQSVYLLEASNPLEQPAHPPAALLEQVQEGRAEAQARARHSRGVDGTFGQLNAHQASWVNILACTMQRQDNSEPSQQPKRKSLTRRASGTSGSSGSVGS